MPRVMLELVRHASGRERDLAVTLWTWLFTPGERAAIAALPGLTDLRDLPPPLTRDPLSWGIAAICRLPPRLRYAVPVIAVLEASGDPRRAPSAERHPAGSRIIEP